MRGYYRTRLVSQRTKDFSNYFQMKKIKEDIEKAKEVSNSLDHIHYIAEYPFRDEK